MKKFHSFLSFVLALLMVLPAVPVFATDDAEDPAVLVTSGLVAHFDGVNNTEKGHNAETTVWEDLAGDNDVELALSETTYFIENALHLSGVQFNFPEELMDVINGEEFTFELKMGQIAKTGSSYSTLVNSTNDNFALFLRSAGDFIEFKNGSNGRPKVAGGKDYVENSTLSLTFSLSEGNCTMYLDGHEIGRSQAGSTIGATAPFFFGHADAGKAHTADYEAMRFYNRALSAEEVAQNAKADGNFDETVVPDLPYTKVEQPALNVIGGLALVETIDSAAKYQALKNSTEKPAVAIYYLDDKLNLTDKEGTALEGLDFATLQAANFAVVPAFYVSNAETVEALLSACKAIGLVDFFVMSDDAYLIKAARAAAPTCRGILDLSKCYAGRSYLTDLEKSNIVRTANTVHANVVVLPENVANKDDLTVLNNSQITPWVKASNGVSNVSEALYLLLSSAKGIISDDTALLIEAAESYLADNTLVYSPLNVGHRGTYASIAKAPENTVENAIVAYANGANALEIDVYMTNDGVIVLNHDSGTGTGKMKNPAGESKNWSVESNSYATFLSTLYYTGYYETDENGDYVLDGNGEKIEYTGYHMSTLEALFEEFKGKDVRLVIEIKSSKEAIVPALKKLIDSYDMYEQCMVIAFPDKGLLDNMMTYFPELSVGNLLGVSSATDPEKMLYYTLRDTQQTSTVPDLNYSGYSAEYVRAATHRGVPVMGWTINVTEKIYTGLLQGLSGITTDNAHVLGALAKTIEAKAPFWVAPGQSATIEATVTTYARKALADANVSLVVLDGEDLVEETSGLTLTFKEGSEGTLSYMVCYTQTLSTGDSYTIYTQPAKIIVSADEVTAPEKEQVKEPELLIIGGNDAGFENVESAEDVKISLQMDITSKGQGSVADLYENKDAYVWVLTVEGKNHAVVPCAYDSETNVFSFFIEKDSTFIPEANTLYTFDLKIYNQDGSVAYQSVNALTLQTGELTVPHSHQWSNQLVFIEKPTIYDNGKGSYICSVCGAHSEITVLDRIPVVVGDLNMDGAATISDVTVLLDYLSMDSLEQLILTRSFKINGEALNCNSDKEGMISIADVTALLDHLSGQDGAIVDNTSTIVQDGLVGWYDGNDYDGTTWIDKAGDNDVSVTKGTFKNGALVLDMGEQIQLPSALYDAVRGSEYTIELNLGKFEMTATTAGGNYCTWLYNNNTERVALFIQNTDRKFAAKISGQGSSARPFMTDAENGLQNATLTVTFKAGGTACLYVNGTLVSEKTAVATNANNDQKAGTYFFLGATGAKKNATEYQGMRFYNRALTAEEVANNAKVDNAAKTVVQSGLVTWYDGDIYDGNKWIDLMGNNDLVAESGTFEDGAYHLASGESQYLPTGIISALQGNSFTIEMNLGDFVVTGTNYTTWLSSFPTGNSEKLSLYIQNSNNSDTFYGKVSGLGRGARPEIKSASTALQDATVTITFEAGGKTILYVNGLQVSSVKSTATTDHGNITSLLLGHTSNLNSANTYFEGLRFYNRALSGNEVFRNYQADCARDTAIAE